MSDSSIEDELFGQADGKPSSSKALKWDFDKPPSYISSPEFKAFAKDNNVDVDQQYGYISL